jgi:Coenzyme PQQ synthesis protein D (PqqD)
MCLLQEGAPLLMRPVALPRAYLTNVGSGRAVRYTAAVTEPLPADAVAVVSADQLSTRLGDEVVILGLRDSVYYGLSDAGARIWDLIQTRRTLGDIVGVLLDEYDVSREEAAAGLDQLIRTLETRGLVAITFPDRP